MNQTRGDAEPIAPRPTRSAAKLYCPQDSTSLADELETARRSLANANRRIARLLDERKRSRATIAGLRAMATTDALTELVNRRRFDRLLERRFAQSITRDTPLSVIMVDVNWFKLYNDTFGHSAGDHVLCVVARHLKHSARSTDIVARYGGDEFAIILCDANASVAMSCAERYRHAISSFEWPLGPVSASFGVATRTASIKDPRTLVEQADRALYHSKRGDRTQVVHMAMLEPTEAGAATARATTRRLGSTPR